MKHLPLLALYTLCACAQSSAPSKAQFDSLLADYGHFKDSIRNEHSYQAYRLDSAFREFRTEDFYQRKDLARLTTVCDSMSKANPKEGKFWRALGTVIGSAVRVVL